MVPADTLWGRGLVAGAHAIVWRRSLSLRTARVFGWASGSVARFQGSIRMADGGLPTLKAGEYGTIGSINGTHTAAKRLADMGFVRGALVTMIRPGEPCIVRIGGRCVGLGDAHQNSILLASA